jgi:hypothetical protein
VLAVILESADPERLYTGLSLLVSVEEARGLATFGALGALVALDDEVRGTHVIASEQEPFARTLVALRDEAAGRIWACSAAVQATGTDPAGLAGVISIPSFLREVTGAQIVVV